MMNESVKKLFEKSKNVLEEKRKIVKQKICIKKTHTFTITAMNFVQEQLKIHFRETSNHWHFNSFCSAAFLVCRKIPIEK